jgi:hypothetical protein
MRLQRLAVSESWGYQVKSFGVSICNVKGVAQVHLKGIPLPTERFLIKEAEKCAQCRRFVAVTCKEWVPQRDRVGSLKGRRYVSAATDWSHCVFSACDKGKTSWKDGLA